MRIPSAARNGGRNAELLRHQRHVVPEALELSSHRESRRSRYPPRVASDCLPSTTFILGFVPATCPSGAACPFGCW